MSVTLRAVIVVATVVAASVAVVGWEIGRLASGGVTRRDAYQALEAAELSLPRDAAQRERLLLAEAMTENEPPAGLMPAARIHRRGTLATLRYQTFDRLLRPLDEWLVRAVVSPLPVLPGAARAKASR
jgi:hypothetical protein